MIDAGLKAGSLIVVRVDWSADPGIQGHWVVTHKKSGSDYAIWDPWEERWFAKHIGRTLRQDG